MPRINNRIDSFDPEESDEMFDYSEKIQHRRHSSKERDETRRKLDQLREKRELERHIRDELYDWD
jgi:hypothetical protein